MLWYVWFQANHINHKPKANQRDGSFGMPLAYINQKNRPFGLWFEAEAWINHTTPLTPPSYEGHPLCPKDKNHSPFHGEKPIMIKWFLERRSYLPKRFFMVGTRYFASASNNWYSIWYYNYGRTWCITSLPGLVFRRRRAVFILLAMPPPSLGRAALGVWCGWFKPRLEIRHATTLTTGAKHWHR